MIKATPNKSRAPAINSLMNCCSPQRCKNAIAMAATKNSAVISIKPHSHCDTPMIIITNESANTKSSILVETLREVVGSELLEAYISGIATP